MLNSSTPRARKAHTCDACETTIEAGDVYVLHVLVDDGAPYRWRQHEICHRAFQALPDDYFYNGEGVPQGWLRMSDYQESLESEAPELATQIREMIERAAKGE